MQARLSSWSALSLCALLSSGCGAGPSGTLSVLTYNVAGLPEGLSKSHPEKNSPLISPLLNKYELVLVQEDFNYHEALMAAADHPYRSVPKEPSSKLVADGLNRLSRTPFKDHEREAWESCNGAIDSGADCLSEKGFAAATHRLGEDLEIEIYNLHLDAGGDVEDISARSRQVDQLLQGLERRAAGKAVILCGDTNLKPSREGDAPVLSRLAQGGALEEVCQTVGCAEPERIDRCFVRGSEKIELTALGWSVDLSFVDETGAPLSDHLAVSVKLAWEAR